MYSLQHIISKCQSQTIDAAWTEMLSGSEVGYDIDTMKSTSPDMMTAELWRHLELGHQGSPC